MRMFLALLIIVYLVGVGVVLAPTISGKWSTATAAELSSNVVAVLPRAFAWPVTAYHSLADQQVATATPAKD